MNPLIENAQGRLALGLVELVDRLYHARLQPGTEQGGDEEQLRFPRAEEILAGADDGLFSRVQRELGLLQTVILYGLPGESSLHIQHRLEHLQTVLGLNVPWMTLDAATLEGRSWQTCPEQRCQILSEVFRHFREDPSHGVQEFVEVLNDPIRLTDIEVENNLVLVSDAEQSFFALLWSVLEAANHADSLERLLLWADLGEGQVRLRCVFCHDRLDEPVRRTESIRRLTHPWNDHYWREGTLAESFEALGLVDDQQEPTPRHRRLVQWLRRASSKPSLRAVQVQSMDGHLSLSDLVTRAVAECDTSDIGLLPSFVRSLVRNLKGCTFGSDAPDSAFPKSDSLRAVGTAARFNLPGEYLLRKYESIDRAFFATPLSELQLRDLGTTSTTAFAIGTILDTDRLTRSELGFRISVLRQLVSAVAEYGLSHRWSEEAVYRAASRNFTHQIAGPLSAVAHSFNSLVAAGPEVVPRRFHQTITRVGVSITVLQQLLDSSTRLIGVERPCRPAASSSHTDLCAVVESLMEGPIGESLKAPGIHLELSLPDHEVLVGGSFGDWATLIYVLFKNAFEAAVDSSVGEDGEGDPRVQAEIVYRDDWIEGDEVSFSTFKIQNTSRPVTSKRVREMKLALEGKVRRISPNTRKIVSHGVGLVIAGERLKILKVQSSIGQEDQKFFIKIIRIQNHERF